MIPDLTTELEINDSVNFQQCDTSIMDRFGKLIIIFLKQILSNPLNYERSDLPTLGKF